VLDSCDATPDSSDVIPVRVPVDDEGLDDSEDDDEEGELQSRPSIQVSAWVKPNDVFFKTKDEFSKQSEHNYIPLTEFSEHPFDTQQKFQQDFPFLHEPVTHESVVLSEGNIRNAFVPPPPLLKEPTYIRVSLSGENKTFAKITPWGGPFIHHLQQFVIKCGTQNLCKLQFGPHKN
jgi:hypothetical protein